MGEQEEEAREMHLRAQCVAVGLGQVLRLSADHGQRIPWAAWSIFR